MLNITHNALNEKVDLRNFKAGKKVLKDRKYKPFNRFVIILSILAIMILFIPWTQTVSGAGYVTTLKPNQRPQTIQSPIPGRIEEWFVSEGDFVKKGDTILFISEVKQEYFDPNLINRTEQQLDAKKQSVGSYEQKIKSLRSQVNALVTEKNLKLKQAKNKIEQTRLKLVSDSIDLEAAKTNLSIAESQYNRTEQLQKEGLKSVASVEEKKLKLQETQAKLISQKNKLLASRNDLINAELDISRISAAYNDKISKAESDRATAETDRFQTIADVSKLETSYANYQKRNDLYYVRAPQSGYINKVLQSGIGETFKEGEKLVSIMPADYDIAVETYISPIDLPLLHLGEKVRVRFDGWPAIVFSGWPNISYGTYGAKIVAIENYISENGKYRVLLAPDEEEQEWPQQMRIGAGASTIALLENVPIWYELWRKLNGFPPNYYTPKSSQSESKKG
ncbi:Multidrug resistance efflux pump [Zhouia amylolytica]|uniref:Multidrug resistance efflux pump n=1 Tax=Zhouia amylolytica TaxID=376730 RepID=A0A1I6V4M2_9FLAO|nr:biotin/lipoyl-binding protein [Zhouia amylolytica]MCQ0110036.1 HlyD family efflux transporter periplasmic adaptor subunit [Zhouia amylolytica]SFT08612.1 Multidrug resistance efflux pump [Zhouia amylolytica]